MSRPDGVPEAEWDELVDKAEVCIAAHLQPSEYDALDDATREAFVHVVNRNRR